MSSSPVSVSPTASMGDLLILFDRHDFNAFPVVDEGSRLVGIVSKIDLLKFFLAAQEVPDSVEKSLNAAPITDVMGDGIVTIEPHESIAAAGSLMVSANLRSLPVVERRNGARILVGMLSRGDVLRGLRFQLVDGTYARPAPLS
ncbi:MAG TPA: CBS domain-containing protein [Gemmatimonadales bacterium]|nr:CBS domain-containing protein [Gemmatimonadales bacterium]